MDDVVGHLSRDDLRAVSPFSRLEVLGADPDSLKVASADSDMAVGSDKEDHDLLFSTSGLLRSGQSSHEPHFTDPVVRNVRPLPHAD